MTLATFSIDNNAVFDIPLTSINEKYNINPREDGIDQEHIQALMYTSPDSYPPIKVATLNGGQTYVIVDGYHRFTAAKLLKVTHLKAVVVSYTLSEWDIEHADNIPTALQLATYDANITHGKPLTINERKEYALKLYLDDTSLSWLQLAQKAKLSDKTVKAHINKILAEDETTSEDTEDRDYLVGQENYTKKLISALSKFYDNESALFGNINGTRSETKRAKALLQANDHTPEVATRYASLARSLNQAAVWIQEYLSSKQ